MQFEIKLRANIVEKAAEKTCKKQKRTNVLVRFVF